MSIKTHATSVHVHRPLDLASIAAVGFDLDHTLALYDDEAVNRLAAAEARTFLVDRLGYPGSLVDAGEPDAPMPTASRSLAIDLAHGAVVKLSAARRVRLARQVGVWLDAGAIESLFGDAVAEHPGAVYHLSSAFDAPTMWIYETMAAGAARSGRRIEPATWVRDIRRMLDHAHTFGSLKPVLMRDLGRYVSSAPALLPALEAWKRRVRLFVVTNSGRTYARAVLERCLGPGWEGLFDIVVTDAGKPAFFERPPSADRVRAGVVAEGLGAYDVERSLGVAGAQILYVGDNPIADVRAAGAFGWRTAHIVPELATRADADGWGCALVHDEEPTWLGGMARAHADVMCEAVVDLLNAGPDHAFDA